MKDGYKVVSRFIGSHNMSVGERQAEDYYATDPIAAEWLLRIEDLQNDIWECACGEGHLAKVFEAAGKNVRATDLIDRNFGEGGGEFSRYIRNVVGGHSDESAFQARTSVCRTRIGDSAEGIKGMYVPEGTVFRGEAEKTVFY